LKVNPDKNIVESNFAFEGSYYSRVREISAVISLMRRTLESFHLEYSHYLSNQLLNAVKSKRNLEAVK
jgi:hypothetical protein